MTKKWVYLFREGDATMRDLLGGKGAGVAEMTRTGVPVPPGFTITTEACNAYYANGQTPPEGMWEQVFEALKDIEAQTGKKFGDPSNPLLVSVRSGAKFSMPGMMDTVLNLGLNRETLEGLAKLTGNPRFAADAYRRFIQLFGKIVLGVEGERFEHVMDRYKGHGQRQDTDLTAEELLAIADEFKAIIKQDVGVDFPEDPQEQLREAVMAVFRSWNGRRARDYRRINKISDSSALPSTCRRWSSAIWAMTRPPAWPLPATPPPGRQRSSASTWSMPRARTWWPAFARPSRSAS